MLKGLFFGYFSMQSQPKALYNEFKDYGNKLTGEYNKFSVFVIN